MLHTFQDHLLSTITKLQRLPHMPINLMPGCTSFSENIIPMRLIRPNLNLSLPLLHLHHLSLNEWPWCPLLCSLHRHLSPFCRSSLHTFQQTLPQLLQNRLQLRITLNLELRFHPTPSKYQNTISNLTVHVSAAIPQPSISFSVLTPWTLTPDPPPITPLNPANASLTAFLTAFAEL